MRHLEDAIQSRCYLLIISQSWENHLYQKEEFVFLKLLSHIYRFELPMW